MQSQIPKETTNDKVMDAFTCPRCGHSTCDKSNFVRHLNRKILCKPSVADVSLQELKDKFTYEKVYKDETYDCDQCGKRFNSRQGRYKHMKTCDVVGAIQMLKKQMADQQREIEFLRSKVSQSNITNNTVNHINNGTVNNNITIEIKNFGQENMAALPNQVILDNLGDYRIMFENLYCDETYPENHNVKLKSKKSKELLIYKNDKWNVLPFANGLDEIFNKLFIEMQKFIGAHKDEVIEHLGGEDELESFNRLMYAAYNKLDERRAKEVRKEADTGIICALEGHRMVVP